MPIVDGLTATKMIRSFEKSHSGTHLSRRAKGNGRVPIFAVSASLVERERPSYINAGFDGWILKPIDFKRLNTLLSGIVEADARNACLYRQGEWENGGWFQRSQPSVLKANTSPSGKPPIHDMDSIHSGDSGSITPTNDKKQQLFFDERNDRTEVEGSEGKSSAAATPRV